MSPISLVRPPLAQFRIALRLSRQFHRSALRAAKPTKRETLSRTVPPDKATRVKRSEVKHTSQPANNNLETEQLKKRWYATHLYNKGQTKIYQAPPSHLGLFSASYIIAGSCIVTAGMLAFSNQQFYDPNGDLPWFVSVAWRLGIITFTIVGGYALIRPLNMVRSIDLVKKHDTVKLLVQVRRPLAFLRPKGHIVDPFNLKVKKTYVRPIEDSQSTQHSNKPTNPISYITQAISKGIFYPFLSVRKLMTFEGVMRISLVEGEKTTRCSLDTDGFWSNDGQDFVQMSVIDL
jgi:hypothetical protein